VQTIYIDPPFNLDSSDQFLYRTNYKDANWATLLENRQKLAKDVLDKKGSIFVRCDYNGNWLVRPLMNEIFGEENFRNEIQVKRITKLGFMKEESKQYSPGTDSLFWFSNNNNKFKFYPQYRRLSKKRGAYWHSLESGGKSYTPIVIDGRTFYPRPNHNWKFSQEKVDLMYSEDRIRINEKVEYVDIKGKRTKGMPEYLVLPSEEIGIDTTWMDIPGYSSGWNFRTENSEILLKRVIESTSNGGDLVIDFFLGSGTTTAVAHKLGRKWIGVEMGEHFYSVILPRMKKVLAYDKSRISKEVRDYQGGGFFKYYELEQYEEALANCKYEDGDLFNSPSKTPYQEYVFMKDEKMLKALEIDYKKDKVKVDLSKLYPNIDIAETLSNLTGKWIKKINDAEVEFEDGTKINTKDLDYKVIKPLIWWE